MVFKIYGNPELKRTKKPPVKQTTGQPSAVQVRSGSAKPLFTTDKSGDTSKTAGPNSTMNSSISSQGSANNYKIVG